MAVKVKFSGKWLFLFVSTLVALVIAMFIFGGYRVSRQALERDFLYEAGISVETFHALQRTIEQELLQEARSIAMDHEVQQVMHAAFVALGGDTEHQDGDEANRQRRRLYDMMKPSWSFDKSAADAHHLHFHLAPEATSFLRIGTPGRFGDSLADSRHTIVDVFSDLQPRAGFEVGPVFTGIRGVVPVVLQTPVGRRLVGSVETGLSYETIVEQIEKISGHDITVLINRGFVARIMGENETAGAMQTTTSCGCLVNASSATLPSVVLEYAQRNGKGLFEKNGQVQFMVKNDRAYVASFFPLRDYLGHADPQRDDIGSIVVWQDVTGRLNEFSSAERKRIYLGVFAYLVIVLLLLFGFRRVAPGLRMEIRTAEEKLERNVGLRRFFEETLNSVDESVLLVSRSGGLEYVNQAVVKHLGYDREALLGMKLSDIDTRFKTGKWHQYWQRLKELGTSHYESVYRGLEGGDFPVAVTASHVQYQDDYFCLVVAKDISAHKNFEQEIIHGNTRYRSVIATARDGFMAVTIDGHIREVNASYCSMTGYDRDELLRMRLADLQGQESNIESLMTKGSDLFEATHRCKDGLVIPVEISASYSQLDEEQLFLFIRDISERKKDERISCLRDKLSSMVHQASIQEVLTAGLDVVEEMTDSEIAFYHFIDPGEKTLTLQAWSTRTRQEMCSASADDRHYPVCQAGVWVDSVSRRGPVVHNDYPALAHRKGLPEGHAELIRIATVPVFRDDKLVALMGVGNKAAYYDDRDVDILEKVADMVYDFARYSETKRHVEFMAYYDMLTGLPNRELFFERLRQNIAQHDRSDQLMALCYLDLDGFKPINDDYGHSIGDQLLISLGGRLSATLREGDTLARIGGDEFLVMLTGLTATREAEHIVQRLINETGKPFDIEGNRLYVTASIGVTLYPTDDTNPDTLLRHADQAMYKAKSLGKSRFSLYELVEEDNLRAEREIRREVHQGLGNDEFVLWYQPRVSLATGEVVGVEALVRWRHPRKGFLPPGAFLSVIEGTADEIALGEWVVTQALASVAQWRQQGLVLPVSINISPNHIQNADFASFLKDSLARYPEDLASLVELEILETAAIGDIEVVVSVMKECVAAGVSFSLDDFGTGYSSLTYFHRLPVDVLKIDQNFVRNMLKDAGALEIVKGVVQLARTLRRPVVAEGVENLELAMMLLDLQCEYAQGYGIARPMPADALVNWLGRWSGNGSWSELRVLSSQLNLEMELKVALYSYSHWCSSVVRYVASNGDSESPLLDEKQCQFGKWQHGIGRVRYGENASFTFLAPRHALAHKLARDIVAYIDHGDVRAALALLVVFNNACDELRQRLMLLDEGATDFSESVEDIRQLAN